MGDICMKFMGQIVSFCVWIVGTMTSIVSKISPVIDDGISIIAGIVGLIGGVIWVFLLLIKKKKEKIELEIAEIELQKLKDGLA